MSLLIASHISINGGKHLPDHTMQSWCFITLHLFVPGWMRQCDIISYGMDVDIGVFIKDYSNLIAPKMINAGFKILSRMGKVKHKLVPAICHGFLYMAFFYIFSCFYGCFLLTFFTKSLLT